MAARERPIVLTTDGGPSPGGGAVSAWARRLARGAHARLLAVPRATSQRALLDLALKRDVAWLVTAGAPRPAGGDAGLATLLGRARCPVLSVPPWARAPASPSRVAVVGVDASREARAAAFGAARLLSLLGAPGRLVLVHGCDTHPAELAARTPWAELSRAMELERHAWLRELADELRTPGLHVERIVQAAWAPDLVGGVAQRLDADFAALGARRLADGSASPLRTMHRRVAARAPCPTLTAAPAA